jgi:hypothetical protein
MKQKAQETTTRAGPQPAQQARIAPPFDSAKLTSLRAEVPVLTEHAQLQTWRAGASNTSTSQGGDACSSVARSPSMSAPDTAYQGSLATTVQGRDLLALVITQ